MNRRELITGVAASAAAVALPAVPKSFSYLQQMIERYGDVGPQPCNIIMSIDPASASGDRTAVVIARRAADAAIEVLASCADIDKENIDRALAWRQAIYESVQSVCIS